MHAENRRLLKGLIATAYFCLLSACAGQPLVQNSSELRMASSVEAAAPRSVVIPQISACDESAAPVTLDPSQPLVLIVHGCFSSAGRFKALAEVFKFHGQQALCFNYNDRDSLTRSSAELVRSIDRLGSETGLRRLTLIGHSQGGLVARRAMIRERENSLNRAWPAIELITISAPFAGIKAAAHCGSKLLRWASLGLTIPICQLATGSKWNEIPPGVAFIRQPGSLIDNVQSHLKIVTDERDSCRRRQVDGRCLESDYVFSLAEQYQSRIDAHPVVENVEIRAGHVEIVGDARVAPDKLIELLQHKGVLARTPVARAPAWRDRLNALYGLMPALGR